MEIRSNKKCDVHGITFDLIGNDKFCDLNCLICCDCLRSLDHQHKHQGINHKTITMQQLILHFNKIRNFNIDSIKKCKEKLGLYMESFMKKLRKEIDKEIQRLEQTIQNIMLTQISKQEDQLRTLQHLYHRRYDQLICSQVGIIAKKLFMFTPTKISAGYKIFEEFVDRRNRFLDQQVRELIKTPYYSAIVMKDAIPVITYPDFNEPRIRIRTQERTPKRSLQKIRELSPSRPQKSLLDIKDFHVKIKRPLQFRGSEIIKSKEEASFIQKLFPYRVYGAKMLYKASENNFSVKRFHQFCDGDPNTITLVKTQYNKIIGGFTPMPWKSTNNTVHSDLKKQSFLFSVSLKQKMNLVDQKSAIFNSANFGPTFGGGADLSICHNSNIEKTSYSQFPFSYANSRYFQNNQHSTFLFTGQQNGNHFLIKEWQVWKVDTNQ